jgi:hypothetical protein
VSAVDGRPTPGRALLDQIRPRICCANYKLVSYRHLCQFHPQRQHNCSHLTELSVGPLEADLRLRRRRVFETVLRALHPRGTGRGEAFAIDASRAVEEYVAVLDDAAFGAATNVVPEFVSPADPTARWTGAHGGQAFAYSTDSLIAVDLLAAGPTAAIIDGHFSAAIRGGDRVDCYPVKYTEWALPTLEAEDRRSDHAG